MDDREGERVGVAGWVMKHVAWMSGLSRDDIIRMAREAGFEECHWASLSGESELDRTLQVGEYPVGESVFKFANLVAAAEREACVELCEELWRKGGWDYNAGYAADKIRARGNDAT